MSDENETSPTEGFNLWERIEHVGGRINAAGYVEFGSPQAVKALLNQYLRDIPPPMPAESYVNILGSCRDMVFKLCPEVRRLPEGEITVGFPEYIPELIKKHLLYNLGLCGTLIGKGPNKK